MAALPHVDDAKHVCRALDLVLKATTPATVGVAHLEANGFPAPAGAQVWTFLRGLGLLDADGRPTERWAGYRSADDPADVLSEIVHDVYASLIAPTGDAPAAADPEQAALEVATFTALCDRAGIVRAEPTAPAQPAPVRPRREVLRDVSDLMQRSVDEFEQARRCLTNDLPRPAHVAAWNSFVSLAVAQLADDDFARLRTSPRRASLSVDDLLRIVPGSELIRILVKHDLVPAADQGTVDDLLRKRNDCVQPTSIVPDDRTTAEYLNAILGVAAMVTGGGAPNTRRPPRTPR